jgi:hypothetical protein
MQNSLRNRAGMPRIAYVAVTSEEARIIYLITNKGFLRASKPTINKADYMTGRAAYVWRMVAFSVSPKPAHHCMPCTGDFDLCERDWKDRREITPMLDELVDRMMNAVPKAQWAGVYRWACAFGQVRTPQVTADGSIGYR